MNNKDYAIYNEHFINPKNNIYYKIYNKINIIIKKNKIIRYLFLFKNLFLIIYL